MDPAEVEFLAEKETVTVVPNFAQDKIYLIGVCSHNYERMRVNSALRFLSTLWPILQEIAHHIQDKLAISFDSSSIGLISYKWFLTIYDKYSSVKTYNEEASIF